MGGAMSSGHFYDRDGCPISLAAWSRLTQQSRVVAFTRLCEGVDIQTVWVGLDMRRDEYGPPLIYETTVIVELDEPRHLGEGFSLDHDIACEWQSENEAEAIETHAELVAHLASNLLLDENPPTEIFRSSRRADG
jgi:hypothetical protein